MNEREGKDVTGEAHSPEWALAISDALLACEELKSKGLLDGGPIVHVEKLRIFVAEQKALGVKYSDAMFKEAVAYVSSQQFMDEVNSLDDEDDQSATIAALEAKLAEREATIAEQGAKLAAAEYSSRVRDLLLEAAVCCREGIEFRFKAAGIRIFKTGIQWRMAIANYGYPADFTTPVAAVEYALAAGWLEQTQQPT